MSTTLLSQRAMLVSLTIGVWSGRKLDREVTQGVNRDNGASADATRVNKDLIGRKALSAIVTAEKAARAFHLARTAPWLDKGGRILSTAGLFDYQNGMGQLRRDFESAVVDFVRDYDAHIQARRKDLGALFKAEDYPSSQDIERSFSFEYEISRLANAADFRVDIPEEQAARIRLDIEERFERRTREAMRDVLERIADVSGHMMHKLRETRTDEESGETKPGIFRDSLVDNIRELHGILPSLNFTGDAGVAAIIHQMSQLTVWDAKDLREDDSARRETADAAQAIYDSVAALMS